jgi:hypothetical protein
MDSVVEVEFSWQAVLIVKVDVHNLHHIVAICGFKIALVSRVLEV